MGTLGNVPHARDSYHRCANWLPHSDELARLRTEAAALRTESDGRRGLLDLAKTQLAEKEAEIAALRAENNRHKERAKTYDDTEEERYTRLLAENGRLGKQLAERDAEAAAQTKQIEALTGRLAYCVDLAAHEQQLAERDAEAAAQTARESALRAERDAAIEREEKRPFTQAWVDKIHSGWTLETAIQRGRAASLEKQLAEANGFLAAAKEERDRWRARYGDAADRLHDATTRPQAAIDAAVKWLSEVDHEADSNRRSDEYELINDLVTEINGARCVAQGFVNGVENTANGKIILIEKQLAEVTREREEAHAQLTNRNKRIETLEAAREKASEDFGKTAAALSKNFEDTSNKLIERHGFLARERDAQVRRCIALETELECVTEVATGERDHEDFTPAEVASLKAVCALRARADKAERERDEAHVQRADRERDWKAASARADKAELERDEDRATVKSISSMLGWGNIPPRDTLERDIRAKRAAYEFERNGRLAAEAQLAAQMEHCKTLVEALRGATDLITSFASGAPINRATIAKTQEKSRAALSGAPAAPEEHK